MEKKMAVVIGGSRGIGFASAKALYMHGYRVLITGKSKENLNAAVKRAEKENIALEIYCMDATRESDVQELFEYISSCGKLYVCVNCVGKNLSKKFVYQNAEGEIVKHSLEEWERTILLNQTSSFLCCREAAGTMIEQKIEGIIINIATALWKGAYAQCAYTAAKAGIISMTRSIAVELSRYGIRCMVVAPGAIMGDALRKACEKSERHNEYMDKLKNQVPLKRFAEESEVSEAILFCVKNKYMTGNIIELDGGGYPPKVIFNK